MLIDSPHPMFKDPALSALLEQIGRGDGEVSVTGLYGASKALLLAILFRELNRPLVVVCPELDDARRLCQDLSQFLDGAETILLPPWDIHPADIFSGQRTVELKRIRALIKLSHGDRSIYVLPLTAFLQKIPPRETFDDYVRTIAIGDTLDRDSLAVDLETGGYCRTAIVEEPGDYAVRGQVVDIFTPVADQPVRLIFAGDEIESIKVFDADSQRTQKDGGELVDFLLPPARELIRTETRQLCALRNMKARANDLDLPRSVKEHLSEMIGSGLGTSINPLFLPLFYAQSGPESDSKLSDGLCHLGSILPSDAVVVLEDSSALALALERLQGDLDRILQKAKSEGRFYLEPEALFADGRQMQALAGRPRVRIRDLEIGLDDDSDARAIRFRTETHIGLKREVTTAREESAMAPLVAKMRGWIDQGNLVAFLCAGDEEVHRITHLLEKYALPIRQSNRPLLTELVQHHGAQGALILRDGKMSGGFHAPALRFTVVSDEEVFGKKVRHRKPKSASEGYFLKSFGELKEGDPVVHTEHGVGIYRGLSKMQIGGIENDFLWIEYLGGDKLFIPVDRMDQIQRYIGSDSQSARVDKLGGTAWEAAKKKARRAAEEIAHELVAVYAAREVMERDAFQPVDDYYEEFASSFEYEETPDQAKAIEDIHADMDAAKPMDRLICGDAGFGKTEIAIRAAFRSVADGRQVAVLVPTTILAEQHNQNFRRRLKNYPIRIEALNRFKTRKEQGRIAEEIGKGLVDIVIGTHRILQDDIAFKDLGLVVVDEEQRFGVHHKEKLKKLRTMVDVLTLSATPIPRTLELSLVGIRDLSIISTPPVDRQAVRTHVLEFDRDTIARAIREEMARGGQVFFLHDRVRSIRSMERLLKELVPEARMAVVHGQMHPREIEEVMVRFIRGECDVLVATTIIGSGIDIASANTIIINRADRFGLSQLYQLRGRVGRSKEAASAWLLIPKGAVLAPDARKRLQVIKDFTEPGSGFRIAAQDLEIRGSGNLLGASQSGHIAAVGYELYIQILESTIRELKGGASAVEEEVRPEIHLGIPAYIPEAFMPDMNRRLTLYKRISLAATDEDLSAIRGEIEDTCGFVALPTENLLQVIGLRNLLKPIRVKKLDYDGQTIVIAFHPGSPLDPVRIIQMTQKKHRRARFTPDLKLHLPAPGLASDAIIDAVRGVVAELIQ